MLDQPAPTTPRPCPKGPNGSHRFLMCEDGYTRSWDVLRDEQGRVTAATHDTFSDDGSSDYYLLCIWCLDQWPAQLADDVRWD